MLKVFGTGLWNITDVKFDGETVFTPDLDRSTTEMSSVVVSPVEEAGAVEVTISNKLGGRNTVNFTCQKKSEAFFTSIRLRHWRATRFDSKEKSNQRFD